MNEHHNDPIIRRLDRLERENWYWKRATLLLLIGIGAAILMGQASKPNVIEGQTVKAQRLEIIDEEGRTRASLRSLGDGVNLELTSKKSETRAELSVYGEGIAWLRLNARQEYTPRDQQTIMEYTEKLNSSLSSEEYNRIYREIQRVRGTQVFLAAGRSSKEANGTAGLTLYGERGASIEVMDQKGTKAILGNIDLEYPLGKSVRRPASSLVLFNKDQKIYWTTP